MAQLENVVCPTSVTLSLIDGKWKIYILWHLGKNGIMRFSDLRRTLPQISHKVLTSQLRELAEDKLVHREVIPDIPPKVEYSLTETGKTLVPLLIQMNKWARAHKLNLQNAELHSF
ncbi:helix-turn-helix domain-containing protein [Brevibacillus brevis]|uniref:Helix-turn-helix domain-containing protein n=1 Tax=Brevibacillus brevis TaxID=1393 RepID=A0ABY9TCM9_BREBE|nr:helix-turn-helix domain-containing protein [Brevibacillus brevis]WNC17816.1 helix-turn-helix domain-containing protein [Brevibacillus brevis]